MKQARDAALLFLSKISTLNGLFILAVVAALVWGGAFLIVCVCLAAGICGGRGNCRAGRPNRLVV